MTDEIPDDIHDALHANELIRDLEAEMEIARLQQEKEAVQARLNEAEAAVYIEEAEKLADAGFEPVSVTGMDSLIYERDGRLFIRAAALKEAR